MLQPPGSSRAAASGGSGNKAYASSRRKTEESPTDVMRKLAKSPPNKKCADCSAKLPQCVNMSVGSFVCMACAGIHREFNNKVKSLGHSTFTNEEVEMMKQTDNDKVNALWLARYDPSRDRIKPPNGNQEQDHLRAWIRRKYQDKQWYAREATQGGAGRRPPPQKNSARQPQPRPTVVQLPPEPKPAAATATVDLFANFDAPAPAPPPTGNDHPQQAQQAPNDDWAAFGGSSQQQQHQQQPNFANFGGAPTTTTKNDAMGQQDPFGQAPFPQQQQQQQNFANFGSVPTNNVDPFAQATSQPQPPVPQNFANFGMAQQQQQPQPQTFTNFGGPQMPTDPFAQPSTRTPTPQQQQPPQPQPQQGGFANFANQQPPSSMAQAQPQSMDPFAHQQQLQQHQQPPQQNQQGGFANFNQPSQQYQNMQQNINQQGGFANFNQTQQVNQQSQTQLSPAQPTPSAAQGFQSFPQQQQQQQQPHQTMIQGNSNNGSFGGNFNPMAGQQQQQQQQQQQLQSSEKDPFANIPPHSQPESQASQTSTMHQLPNGAAAAQQVPNPSQNQNNLAHGGVQDQALPSQQPVESSTMSAGIKEDPMDAFAHLSMNGPPDGKSQDPPPKKDGGTTPKYAAQQLVCYKSNGNRTKVKIVKVHLDDELQPYYTIQLPFGSEKQTDDAHLGLLDPSFETIETKLLTLSPAQLKQVANLIASLEESETNTTSAPPPAANSSADGVVPLSDQVMPLAQPNQQPASMISMQQQIPASVGMNTAMTNGRGDSKPGTIPSPSPSKMGAGQASAPPMYPNIAHAQQQNMQQQVQPQQLQQIPNSMTMPQQMVQPQQGITQTQPQQSNYGMSIPSPVASNSMLAGLAGASQMLGALGAPPFVQQQHQPQQSMSQPYMMQAQFTVNGQAQPPQMTLAQPPPQQMPLQQPSMPQQPQNHQFGQVQQQLQMQGPPGQAPQSPQGNPFDMY